MVWRIGVEYVYYVLLSYGFCFSLKSPSSFSSTQSFKHFVYKTVCTTLVNTYEVEISYTWTLVMTAVPVTGRSTLLLTFVVNVHH